eukprot:11127464-Alexandrium_andersonii.AAC.1
MCIRDSPKAGHLADKMTRVSVASDGPCLWHALAGAMAHRKISSGGSDHVRSMVAMHMHDHREWREPSWGRKAPSKDEEPLEDFAEYLTLLSQLGAWGSELEVYAAA